MYKNRELKFNFCHIRIKMFTKCLHIIFDHDNIPDKAYRLARHLRN